MIKKKKKEKKEKKKGIEVMGFNGIGLVEIVTLRVELCVTLREYVGGV